ncbi:hypothetical protein HPB49_023496 [Dermacentor silvarum]|uniref:Uncharacterized protein n=1 Tax=Dermacentor silvarum TaxID=543639 RepID=A0ACB8E438_DERSI|nr:hypothetical protein HPB49_023496 [Dermacentor silvarum]
MAPTYTTDAEGWATVHSRKRNYDRFLFASYLHCPARLPDSFVNAKLLAADPLTIPNFQLAARIYQATPPNTCRGVIHDITPKTSSAVLMGNLWDPDSGILTARMMSSTHTAIITFSGSHIPRWVNYRGVMVR